MEIIATIKEADVYKESDPTPKESYGPLRKTSRVALFDEHNNVALHYYSTNGGYFMIGGGVEAPPDNLVSSSTHLPEQVVRLRYLKLNQKNTRSLVYFLESTRVLPYISR